MSWGQFKLSAEKNRPLYLMLADELRRMIVSGEIAPGDRIPSSRDLQKQLGLSAVTIENGLNLLVEEKYLCRRPRCGTTVAPVLPTRKVVIDTPPTVYAVFTCSRQVGAYGYLVMVELERRLREAGYPMGLRVQIREHGLPPPVEIPRYRNCAGVILCGYNSRAFVDEIQRQGVPVVLIGSLDSDGGREDDLDMVVHNDRERAALSASHLLDLGHRRLACVTAPTGSLYSAKQRAGFVDALKAYGLSADDALMLESPDLEDSEYDGGVDIGYEIFCRRNRPTAVYAGYDTLAWGIIEAGRRLGLSTPNDYSIIGGGGVKIEDRPMIPVLTRTQSMPEESARLAVEKLLRQIADPSCPRGTAEAKVTAIEYGETTRIHRAIEVEPAPVMAANA